MKIRTLLLTGANNHDWQKSTPFCQELLEGSGRFEVTVVEDPSGYLGDPQALQGVQLLFSDYNGPAWSEAAQANFERAVREGAGLVILHAADNAFAGWEAYERMVALHFREGSGHGEFHEFQVEIVDREHPITRGVADFSTWDELYHRLVPMHGVAYQVLARAYSDPAKGGSGQHEPMLVTTQHGQGRVYHHILGHVWPHGFGGGYKGATMMAFEAPEFRQTLLRGCEWAATGGVTLP